MSGTLNEQLQQISDTKDAIAQAISGKGVEVTPEDSFASYALKINEIQGGSGETTIVQGGFNLFDIKIADHKLEGNEALGWAEQGTNVYKTDYPDFYAKCLEEYKNPAEIKSPYAGINGTVIGTLKDTNGVVSGFSTANYIDTETIYTQEYTKFEIQIKVTTGSNISTAQMPIEAVEGLRISLGSVNSSSMGKRFGYNIAVTGEAWQADDTNGRLSYGNKITVATNTTYLFKMTYDGELAQGFVSTDNGETWVQDWQLSCNLTFNGCRFKLSPQRPWSGSVDLSQCYAKINDELIWVGTKSLDLYVNENEHTFTSSDNIDEVDKMYSQTGNADIYIINEEEEYVILPRNSHFDQEEAIRKTYYCVGNTVVDESTIDISKEIELNTPFFLGMSQYFENEPNNLSWLKSTGEFHSKEMYPSMFEYIKENIEKGTKDFKRINEEYDDYSYILDEDNNLFRLPLLNGSEDRTDNGEMLTNVLPSTLVDGNSYTFIAPCNGSLKLANTSSSGLIYMTLHSKDGIGQGITVNNGKIAGGTVNTSLFMLRGQKCIIEGIGNATLSSSIFVKTVGNGSLYYFVGEAINNANLVNVANVTKALANKVDINSDRFDGQWISSDVTIVASASFSSSNVTYDLSEYLPNDGYEYEVIIGGYLTTSASSGKLTALYVGSDIMSSSIYLGACITRTSSNAQAAGAITCPVGLGRSIFVQGNSSSGTYTLHIHGYRRLGRI